MKKFLIMLIVAAMLIPSGVSADDFGNDAAVLKDGYTVTWINSGEQKDYSAKSVFQTITQGETDWILTRINSIVQSST
ncbi:MAG: hypothetical protein PHV39_06890 [Methanomicrobium sp.]|nr:hypothetical protein [Methanomicrobium sp.]